MEWVKEHPYLAGALAVLLLVLYFAFRSKSTAAATTASTVSGTSDTIQMAQLQAATAIQEAQLGANVQVSGQSAAVQVQGLNDAAGVQVAQLQQQVQLQGIVSSQQVSDFQTAAQLQLGLAQIGNVPSQSVSTPAPSQSLISSQPANPFVDQQSQQTYQAAIQSQNDILTQIASSGNPAYTATSLMGLTCEPGSSNSLLGCYNPSTGAATAPIGLTNVQYTQLLAGNPNYMTA